MDAILSEYMLIEELPLKVVLFSNASVCGEYKRGGIEASSGAGSRKVGIPASASLLVQELGSTG